MSRSTGSTTARRSPAAGTGAVIAHDLGPLNEVRLRGRLAAPSAEIPLPSGDVVAGFRLNVERPPQRRRTGTQVDSLECKAYAADLRRRVARFAPGDVLEVSGTLQRRFFRTGGGPASRYDVVVTTVARVARADAVHRATMAG
jgi:single-strand DNA-binding protein